MVNSRLYVGSLGAQATEQDVKELFGKFGDVTEVRMNRNFAFVQYKSDDFASAALSELNGKNHFGRTLDIQFAKPPRNPVAAAAASASHNSSGGGGNDNANTSGNSLGGGPDGGNSGGGGPSPFGGNLGGGGPSPFGGNSGGGGPSPFGGMSGGGGRDDPQKRDNRNDGPAKRDDRNDGPRGGRRGPPPGRGNIRDRSPLGNRGGPGGRDGPFGRDRSPFGNRGGGFGDRDRESFGGRDNNRDFGDRFSGGRGGDSDRGPTFGGRDSWGERDRAGPEWGRAERDRAEPWNGAGRGPRDDFRDGPDFRGAAADRDRDFGRGLDRADFRDRAAAGDFGGRGRGWEDDRFGGRPGAGFRDEPPPFGRDREFGRDFDRSGPAYEKPPNSDPIPLNTPNAERTNDIEIIVMSKSITEYGEYIESRLKSIGFTVDIMFPNETAPIPRVLGNIASRGTLYAIIVNPAHKLNRSLTLQVLYGTPQEHRNILIEDAIIFLNRNFENYSKRMAEKRGPNAPPEQVRHLLELIITASRQLTTTQFDILIQYFINEKLKVEPPPTAQEPLPVSQQAELQTRILSILNKNAGTGAALSGGPSLMGNLGGAAAKGDKGPEDTPSPLLKDPSVQRALDSLMQGGSNILNAFGNQKRF